MDLSKLSKIVSTTSTLQPQNPQSLLDLTMTQNTQSSAEIDREIFFLCSALINKKKCRWWDNMKAWTPSGEVTHTRHCSVLQMASSGFHMRQWAKRSWIPTGKRKEQKIVWLIFPSLARNRWETNKKQLRNVGSKNTLLFSVLQNCRGKESGDLNAREKKYDSNFNDHSSIHGQNLPTFPGKKSYLLCVVSIQ